MPDKRLSEADLPNKMYFKIREVARIAGLPTYVLRFWETEFRGVRPRRTPSGQRMYRKSDILKILEIKHLLHERKFTIEGARRRLDELRERRKAPPGSLIDEIRAELLEIRSMLT